MTIQRRTLAIGLPTPLGSHAGSPRAAPTLCQELHSAHLRLAATLSIRHFSCPEQGHSFAPRCRELGVCRRRTCRRRTHEQIIPSGDQRFMPSEELTEPAFYP